MNVLMGADGQTEDSCHPDVWLFLEDNLDLATRPLLSSQPPETVGTQSSGDELQFKYLRDSFFESRKPSFLKICAHTHVFGLSLAGMHEFNNRVSLLCSTFSSWDPWIVLGQQLLDLVKSYNDKIKKICQTTN